MSARCILPRCRFELPNLYIVHCGHSVQIQCVGPAAKGRTFTFTQIIWSNVVTYRLSVAGGPRLGSLAVVMIRPWLGSPAAEVTRRHKSCIKLPRTLAAQAGATVRCHYSSEAARLRKEICTFMNSSSINITLYYYDLN